jgi:hypothetical protein
VWCLSELARLTVASEAPQRRFLLNMMESGVFWCEDRTSAKQKAKVSLGVMQL